MKRQLFLCGYPTIFEDKFGKEKTICYSDGYTLRIEIRGVTFHGISFNTMESEEQEKNVFSHKFDFKQDLLCAVFRVEIPLTIANERNGGTLAISFDYRTGNDLTFSFNYNEQIYSSDLLFDSAEDVLIALQKLLPTNCRLQCCMSCRFSSYHPVGNNDFGTLNCLINLEKQLYTIVDKGSLMALWEKGALERKLIDVQETFLCPQFEEPSESTWMYKSY